MILYYSFNFHFIAYNLSLKKTPILKDNLFNKWCWENWSTTCKRMQLEHFLTPYTKINSKWIKDSNSGLESIKFLEENIFKALPYINHSRVLYDTPPRVMEIKAKINKWDLIKIKSLCTELCSHPPPRRRRSPTPALPLAR